MPAHLARAPRADRSGRRRAIGVATAGREGSLGRGARERILAAASELFARQGFNATRINELHVAARVSKRTLYQHFDSRDDLILAYLAQYASTAPGAAVLAREDLAPRTRLLEMFTALADRKTVIPDPVLSAAAEFPDRDHPVHQAARAHADDLANRLAALARAAGARDPERTARGLLTLYDGACSRLVLEEVTTVVDEVYPLAAALLRDAID